MQPADYEKLMEDLESELLRGARAVGILGLTPVTTKLIADIASARQTPALTAVFADRPSSESICWSEVPVKPLQSMGDSALDVLVVASDEDKEDLLEAAVPFILGAPKVIVAGYGHLRFRDRMFTEELAQLLVPSLANGYPNTLPHLYQCLANAARTGLRGVVAEFGMFKGGTTMFLSRLIERLGQDWPVIGFDTFGGFPPRRSPLDMYDHPGCVFENLGAVRHYVQGTRIEIVPGDIVQTCHRLDTEDLVLTFIDTDNYTSAKAAIDVVRERTVLGGAIVFDHFTGLDRFRYTLGERIAAKTLLGDVHYFNLHDTGVFFRQR